jgi:hypothetical protein
MNAVATNDCAPHHEQWTRDYWLCHCEGYRVDSSDGHLGFVEEVVQGAAASTPTALKIRAIVEPYDVFVLPVEQIREFDPGAERIVVELERSGTRQSPSKRAPAETNTEVRAKPGDWVVVHAHALGEPERAGEILEVLGDPGHERFRVRWDEEHESVFYPGSDAGIRRASSSAGRRGERRPAGRGRKKR